MMQPNGVTHFHVVKLITVPPDMKDEEIETYYLPDKAFHDLRTVVRFAGKEIK
jgi:hypothetical protein